MNISASYVAREPREPRWARFECSACFTIALEVNRYK